MTIRTLELVGTDPKRWGEQHGEAFRDDVRAIAELRMALTLSRTDLSTPDNVLALARLHLPVLERFDRALYDELCGIARGAGLQPEHIVVANHYTDLRDLKLADLERLLRGADPGAADPGADPGGCTAMFLPTTTGDGHRVLGQTWDMHGSAEPFALLIKIPALPDRVDASDAPARRTDATGVPRHGSTLVFSITGCLGMTGLSSWGTALTINNLNSLDATVGVVWPALVRKALRQPSARAMKDLIWNSPIGSGRHYIVADDKDVFGIETSGTKKKLIEHNSGKVYFHTNHCVDDEMKPTCRILPGSTTLQRYDTIQRRLSDGVPADLHDAFFSLESVGLKQNPTNPHDVATCGALVMDLSARNAIACTGIPSRDADAIVVEVR